VQSLSDFFTLKTSVTFKYKSLIVVKKRIDKYINNEWGNVPI
jgi:hypothetical protein